MLRRLAALLVAVGFTCTMLPARATHAAPAPLTTVRIALNWLTNVEFAGIWVAQEKGWWRQAGLSVSVKGYDFTHDPTQLVGSGQYDFGFQDGAALIAARSAGQPITALWAGAQASAYAFISMPTSGITTPRQFKGKKIGYQAGERYVLDTMLSAVGLSEKDCTPVVVGFDPTVLIKGKVDAYLAFLTNEPIELGLKYHIVTNLIPAYNYGYDFYGDVLFSSDHMLRAHPALARTVVAVIDRGWKYALNHEQEVAHYVVQTAKLDTTDTMLQQNLELKGLAVLASLNGASIGSMVAPRWADGIGILARYRQIKAAFPANTIFTSQFQPR